MRFLFSLIATSLAIILCNCSKHQEQTLPPSLTIDKLNLSQSSAVSHDSFLISSNVNWRISSVSSWVTATPGSGSGNALVHIDLQGNSSLSSRSADLTIRATGVNDIVMHITQNGSAPFMTVDKDSLHEQAQGQLDSIVVTANVRWNLAIPSGASSWISSDKTSDTTDSKVHLTISANTTTNSRTAAINLSSTNTSLAPIAVTVTQEQPDVVISTFAPFHARGEATITIDGNGFSPIATENQVKINGVTATVNAATANSITVTVPAKVGSGPIEVKVNTKSDTAFNFTYDWVGNVVLVAGSTAGYLDGNGPNAQFLRPAGLALDKVGNLYVADYANYRVRKISPSGDVTTLPGRVPYDPNNPGSPLIYGLPSDVALDDTGNIYVTETNSNAVSKISPSGQVTLLAGGNAPGYIDGTGTAASFYWPCGITTDASGNSFVADFNNYRIRKVTSTGVVTTIAGGGGGFSEGIGAAANFNRPYSLVLDHSGNLFVTDFYNERIRKITPAGEVTTFAGNGGSAITDGIGAEAQFNNPLDIAIDETGNLYVGDNSDKIRIITPSAKVTTIGTYEDPNGSLVEFNGLYGIVVDPNGIIYVSDYANNKIWKIVSIQ